MSGSSAFLSPYPQKVSSPALDAARNSEAFDDMDVDDPEDVGQTNTDNLGDDNAVDEVHGDDLDDWSESESCDDFSNSLENSEPHQLRIEMVSDNALAKTYQVEENDKNLYLIPPAVSAKRSPYARLVDGYNPYKVDREELRELRMKFENAKGRRVMNLRVYDAIAMLHKDVEHIPKSRKQAFIDLLKTLEQKWRDANKPREPKQYREPHPRSSADYLKLMHSLKPEESSWFTMGTDTNGTKGGKPSTSNEPVRPVEPCKSTDNSQDFLKTPQGITPPTTPTKSIKPSPAEKTKAVLSKEEEGEHPWMPTPKLIADTKDRNGLLLRAWDQMSECKINDNTVGFLSGASWFPLGSAEDRHEALKCHANWGNRVKTPLISTTTSIHEIELVRIPSFTKRQDEKGIKRNSKLTIINAHARFAKELPVLSMDAELNYYNVETPYGDRRNYKNSYYTFEYILPFRVGIDEIVATWCWQDIERTARKSGRDINHWFRTVAVPLYEEHEAARKAGRPMKFKELNTMKMVSISYEQQTYLVAHSRRADQLCNLHGAGSYRKGYTHIDKERTKQMNIMTKRLFPVFRDSHDHEHAAENLGHVSVYYS
ncbi:hypothetical protein BKA61DRAFT_703648 [Leptodontidium sp. MPI-SDFR-AT-0119]|nr:hypothetical protein BKA61DRAFT_703648 [Leptodontidium sp. MPI-SDFR-AT-0119]